MLAALHVQIKAALAWIWCMGPEWRTEWVPCHWDGDLLDEYDPEPQTEVRATCIGIFGQGLALIDTDTVRRRQAVRPT